MTIRVLSYVLSRPGAAPVVATHETADGDIGWPARAAEAILQTHGRLKPSKGWICRKAPGNTLPTFVYRDPGVTLTFVVFGS